MRHNITFEKANSSVTVSCTCGRSPKLKEMLKKSVTLFTICSEIIRLFFFVLYFPPPVVGNGILAVVGYTAEVPCEVTPLTKNDAPHLILWYNDIFGTPIYR